MEETRSQIREFVVENFLFGDDSNELTKDTSFTEGGIIDSTGVLSLIMFLEDTFGIEIEDEEMTLENLDSIEKAAAFVSQKTGAAAA